MSLIESLSPRSLRAPESGIVEVVNYARGREGLIPLWVGEGDLPTPDFIARPAAEALMRGETFYTWQRGIPELRAALSRYYGRRFGAALSAEHFYVVGSGMQAIKLTIEALLKSRNASVASFVLYVVGEGIEKKVSDFAAEVAAQAAAAQK